MEKFAYHNRNYDVITNQKNNFKMEMLESPHSLL